MEKTTLLDILGQETITKVVVEQKKEKTNDKPKDDFEVLLDIMKKNNRPDCHKLENFD